ncbi:restriction endonuclease EcoRII [Bradyrhizobium macuxiense]|uniref:Restriction endonuclease EcoRII n=1 Tax=Bradyrhizobium macuxiense TaxID=1755647 RepID=A0A560LZU9_9BRAD|nr:type II restriction endonuclease [Bradyrhizobium macuxiense]TWC00780.1 restriction endonuclease EcoRII [Bradyrhizobium macuxiense]
MADVVSAEVRSRMMAGKDVDDWIVENKKKSAYWIGKRLSSNDTGLTGNHQYGPLIVKTALFRLFPKLSAIEPSVTEDHFSLEIDSHAHSSYARAVWYKSKNEGRFTNLGGTRSPLLDPENTGGLAVFAFRLDPSGKVLEGRAWVCRSPSEEDRFEALIGPVEPREFVIWENAEVSYAHLGRSETQSTCWLDYDEIPREWLQKFPTGQQILTKVIERRAAKGTPDQLLMQRRKCEYEMFQSIEEATFLPKLTPGFKSVSSFTALAQSILQSRKSRAGNSLELHARQIFEESGLRSGQQYSHKPKIDGNPDFIFPSAAAYSDLHFPTASLRMLAAKTTCKDRWRQVTKEAKRLTERHLLTLQVGVTESQFAEMSEAGVRLVVPTELHKAYPAKVRTKLISLESFIKGITKLKPYKP